MRRRLVPIVFGLLVSAAAPAAAQAASLGIDVLSNRADLISAGDALVEVKIPAGVNASKVRVYRRRTRRDELVRAAPQRALRGRRRRPRARRERPARDRAGRPGREHHGHRTTRTADPCSPGRRSSRGPARRAPADAQCNQPATYAYQYKSSRHRPVRRLRPGRARRPTSRRRRPTRARRCRTSSASRPATRTATSTRSPCSTTRAKPFAPWSPQERLEPQAADHPRRELRHRAPGRHGARRR